MEEKNIRKKIYAMIVPIITQSFLVMMTDFVSMGMIGRIDVFAVGAQGLSGRIIGIVWCLFNGISIGTTILVSYAYGSEDSKKIKKVAQQSLISIVGLIIIAQQLMYWNASTLLKFFKPKPEMLANSLMYMRIILIGLPFQGVMMVVTGILQGMGDATTPMKITIIVNLVNIVCGYTLIFGHFGFKTLGLKGAAISLVTAQFVGALIGLWVLFNKNGVLGHMKIKKLFKIDTKQITAIFKVGLPSSFESIFWQLSAIILSRVMLSFGEVPFASYQLGLQAENISDMLGIGFGIVATTFIGQTYGAKDKKLGKAYFKEIIKGSLLFTAIGTALLVIFPRQIMRLLTDNKEVIKLGSVYIFLMGLIQIPQGVQRVFNGALKGAGYTRIPMIIAAIGLWGIRVPVSLILTYYFKLDITSIWVVICIDQVCRFILSYILFKKKDIFAESEELAA